MTELRVRLDKWLWAARLFKTRGLANEAASLGRIEINGQAAKSSREVRVGDLLQVRLAGDVRMLCVKGLSPQRGPAEMARLLYEETPESVLRREQEAARRRSAPEPASALTDGRPTKRNRRQLAEWDRWSAHLDDA